jgi:hypothetical protein
MIKAKILVMTDNEVIDISSTIINIVAVPRKGDFLWLSAQTKEHLRELATKDLETARQFAPTWFYGKSHGVTQGAVKQKDVDNLTFDDLNYVDEVMYHEDLDYVTIVMKADYQ